MFLFTPAYHSGLRGCRIPTSFQSSEFYTSAIRTEGEILLEEINSIYDSVVTQLSQNPSSRRDRVIDVCNVTGFLDAIGEK